jgi:DNA-directed RNA polymerase subunit H (RpoH/RPB5)
MNNLVHYCENRKIEIEPNTFWGKKINNEDLINKININNLVQLNGKVNGKTIIIIVLLEHGVYSNHIQNVRNLVKLFEGYDEAIIVSDTTFSSKSNIVNLLEEFVSSGKLRVFNYKTFITNILTVPIIPKHEIMTEEEIAKLLEDNRITKANLPMIKYNDPPIIWINAKIGDVIRIYRFSPIIGSSLYYRIVI